MFHNPPNPADQSGSDTIVLNWDYYDPLNDPDHENPDPDESPYALAGEPDSIAGIGFGEIKDGCYDAPQTSSAAWNYAGADRSHRVTLESVEPSAANAVWRVKTVYRDSKVPSADHGYVAMTLRHRSQDCSPSPDSRFQEIQAAGHYTHHQDGDGTWTVGVSLGGWVNLEYTFRPDAEDVEHKSTDPITLHYGGLGGAAPTRLVYTGPTRGRYHAQFTASARLTASTQPGAEPTEPVPGAPVSFALGTGGDGQSCTDTTSPSGVAFCSITPTQRAGSTTLTVRYAGGGGYDPSSAFVPFTILRQATDVSYTGPERVANGASAQLSGVLREQGGPPIEGRKLHLTLGSEESQQACTGTTNSSGVAQCTIDSVDQPLNATAAVPVSVGFTGDPYYLPASESAAVLLEYYTGRSFGLTGTVSLALVPLVSVEPKPDTGAVRTARAFESTTPCVADVDAVGLLAAGALCPKVTTRLAPGTSTSTAMVARTTIGIPGIPAIEVHGATATSTSTCGSGGSASGSTDIATLYVGGQRVPVSADFNAEIDLPGVARLVVNEQVPVAGADHGLTVNALHLTAAGDTDIVIASATSDVHNCVS